MKTLTWSAVVLLSMTSLSFGELSAGSQTLTLVAGGGFSGSEFDHDISGNSNKHEKIASPGGAFGAQYVYYLRSAPAVGLGLDILNSSLQEHFADSLSTQYNFRTRFQPTTVLAVAKLAFGQGRIHPYLFGGIGFHRTSFYWDFQPKGSTTWFDTNTQDNRRIVEGTATGFAGAGGIGVDIFLTPSVFLGAEGRGTYLGTATYPLTAQARALGFSGSDPRGDFVSFNLLACIGVKFGAN